MKHRIFALSFLLLTACLFQLLLAQAANPYQATISEFEALVEKEISDQQLVGFSAAFSFGAVQWARGFGYADLENRVEATELSSYRMASVSKPMTAVGILELVEQGAAAAAAVGAVRIPYVDLGNGDIDVFIRV